MKKLLLVVIILIILVPLILFLLGFRLDSLFGVINQQKQGQQPFKISGPGMDPNYKDGQYWLGIKYTSSPQRGDVIILTNPADSSQVFDKRIVGLPGDKIMIKSGQVYLNGQILKENYLTPNTTTSAGRYPSEGEEIVVPNDQYFVLGDNRSHSSDSRSFGFVPLVNIQFKLTTCYKGCS